MQSIAEKMFNLFRGNSSGHGTYAAEERSPGKVKAEIKKTARTLRTGPSVELWEKHLQGTSPLGVIPIMQDGTCYWGVIDVDKYDLVHADIVKKVDSIGLPAVVCRSKSGGAHIFVFFSRPIAAADLMAKLREWAAVLGYGDCEVFPKQTEVLADRGDLGNWLNMPYFDADQGTRYAVREDGRGLSVQKFIDLALSKQLTPEEFITSSPVLTLSSEGGDLADGPPCLEYLASVGVSEGGRNNALFAFGVLAKKKHPDGWEAVLEDWNRRFLSPPLSTDEVSIILRSLRKKDYAYKCKDAPLCSHCDQNTCRERKYGVGGELSPEIASISILDSEPPLFFVALSSGGTVECSPDDLLSSRAFQKAALTQLRVLLPLFKQNAWQTRVQECLDQAILIEAPSEVGVEGTFTYYLEQFCTDRHAAQEKDEIILGKPWFNEADGMYYFRLFDLMGYLDRVKFKELKRNQITTIIRKIGGDHTFFNLRGKGTNVWTVPASAFSIQTERFDPPRMPDYPV